MKTIEYYIAREKLKKNDFNTINRNLVMAVKCKLYNQAITITIPSEQ